MEKHKLLIPEKALTILIALVFAPMILLALLSMLQLDNAYFSYMLYLSLVAHFIIFWIVLVDIIKNKFDYKPFWIVSLFVFNLIATYLYLYHRESMLENYISDRENGKESSVKFNTFALACITVSVLVGAIMKIYHLPGAGILLMVGLAAEALFFVFIVVQSQRKK